MNLSLCGHSRIMSFGKLLRHFDFPRKLSIFWLKNSQNCLKNHTVRNLWFPEKIVDFSGWKTCENVVVLTYFGAKIQILARFARNEIFETIWNVFKHCDDILTTKMCPLRLTVWHSSYSRPFKITDWLAKVVLISWMDIWENQVIT